MPVYGILTVICALYMRTSTRSACCHAEEMEALRFIHRSGLTLVRQRTDRCIVLQKMYNGRTAVKHWLDQVHMVCVARQSARSAWPAQIVKVEVPEFVRSRYVAGRHAALARSRGRINWQGRQAVTIRVRG